MRKPDANNSAVELVPEACCLANQRIAEEGISQLYRGQVGRVQEVTVPPSCSAACRTNSLIWKWRADCWRPPFKATAWTSGIRGRPACMTARTARPQPIPITEPLERPSSSRRPPNGAASASNTPVDGVSITAARLKRSATVSCSVICSGSARSITSFSRYPALLLSAAAETRSRLRHLACAQSPPATSLPHSGAWRPCAESHERLFLATSAEAA